MSGFIRPINGSKQFALESQEAKETQENERYYQPTSFAIPQQLYRAQEGFVNLDFARRSEIEALRSERGGPSPSGKDDEKDRFGKVAASPNSPNLTEGGITSFAIPQGRPKQKQTNNPSPLTSKLVIPFSKRPSGKVSPFPPSSGFITVEGLDPSALQQNAIAAAIKAAESGEAIATRHLHQRNPYPRQRNFCPLVLIPISTQPQEGILKRKREEETSTTCLKCPEQLSSSSMPSRRSRPLLLQPQQPHPSSMLLQQFHPSTTPSQQVPLSTLSMQSLEGEVMSCLNSRRLTPDERKELAVLIIRKADLGLHDRAKLQQVLDDKSLWKQAMLIGKKRILNEIFLEIRGIPNFRHLDSESVEKKEARICELKNKF